MKMENGQVRISDVSRVKPLSKDYMIKFLLFCVYIRVFFFHLGLFYAILGVQFL
jgi:hypothetical protein